MNGFRYRIRFSKDQDLRLISHRDLVRVFERMFRRAELNLKMSEGFHPKAKMSFPSALALGVRGADEVMELELTDQWDPDRLRDHLAGHALDGLSIATVQLLPAGERKAQVDRMWYEFPVPPDRHTAVEQSIDELLAQSSVLIRRANREHPIDLRAGIETLLLHEGQLRMCLLAGHTATTRPQEVLDAIGLGDLAAAGFLLTRTTVQLADQT